MSLFDKLLVAHLVGDWLLQTECQALNKAQNLRALFSHIGIYTILMLGVLVFDFGYQNTNIYFVVGMLAVTHAFLDRRWLVIRFMKAFRLIVVRKPERWLVLSIDQVLHISFLAFAVFTLLTLASTYRIFLFRDISALMGVSFFDLALRLQPNGEMKI